jgi:transcription termination factor Rho
MSPKPQKPEFSAAVLETLPPEDRTELYEAVIRTGADTRLLQDLDLAGLTAALAGDGLEAPPGSPPALMRALLLHHRARQFGIGWVRGILDVTPDGFGFLRSSVADFAPSADDVYVTGNQLHHLGLRTGLLIEGPARPPRATEQFAALLRVETVAGRPFAEHRTRVPFELRTPVLPTTPLMLEPTVDDLPLRTMRALSPWGHGQRVLLDFGDERIDRLDLLRRVATAALRADPSICVRACLLDAAPEERTVFAAALPRGCVVAATFDEPPSRQIDVAELALAAAQREAEAGARVLFVFDSLSSLARAGQLDRPRSGRLATADMHCQALVRSKRLFAAARNLEGGGALTLLATLRSPNERVVDDETVRLFAQKANALVAFAAGDTDDLPDPARTRTRHEDLLTDGDERRAIERLRSQLRTAQPSERVAIAQRAIAR